ncbi:MAG: ParB N-terminal domain-containing protein [Sphingomonadales bacterium]|nr:ParB N-terminal domain-containing protein [Sphingomonadales bacterium]
MPDDKSLNTDQFHKDLLGLSRMRRRSLKGTRDVEAATSSARRNDLAPDLELRMVPPASLTASLYRTRKTTADQLARVCDSIRAFGISRPIAVDGKGEVIDGHIVLEAAFKLGLEEVPVIVCKHLAPTQVRQLRLAFNRIAEKGEWDLDALKLEFEALIELEADIEITGFSKAEGDIILLSTEPTVDTVEEPDRDAEPVSQPGDVWMAGPHLIVCGDARFPETYQVGLSGEIQAVVADFPYNARLVAMSVGWARPSTRSL